MATTDDPWVPGNSDDDGQTPPWSEIFRLYCDAKSQDIAVAMPCMVTAVKTNNRVDLQPLLMRTYKGAVAPSPLPTIQDAFVGTPRGATWFIQMPIAVGDTGMAIFADRSLDTLSASGGMTPVDPVDTRCHNMSDAVFYPGLYPFTNPIPTSTLTDMVLQNGLAQIFLQKGGTFMQGNGVIETYDQLVMLTTAMATMATGAAAEFTTQAAAATAAAGEFTAQATASVGPLLPLAPGFTALAATFAATATSLTATATTFTAAAASFTTAMAAFTALMGEPGE